MRSARLCVGGERGVRSAVLRCRAVFERFVGLRFGVESGAMGGGQFLGAVRLCGDSERTRHFADFMGRR